MKYLKVWTSFLELMKTLEYDEIGRLFEMMLIYAESGEEPEVIDGNERFLWPVAKQQIDLTAERNETLRANGMKGGRPKAIENQTKPNKTKQNQIEPEKSCKEKERKEKEYKEKDLFIDDDNARAIQKDHDRILDAADDAGFKISNSVRAALIRLYAENGLQKVLDGIASCVKHGAPNLAYLEACMKDKPKAQKPPKVEAQDFPQRDYNDVNDEMMEGLAAEVEAFLSAEKAGAG